MPIAPRKTADLVKDLCVQLGHEEGAASCIKKLVADNWLVTVSDLREVPLETFEKHGLPLKLCFKLVEYLAEEQAADYWNGIQSSINYTLRPGLARLTASTVSFLQKKTNPEAWAARRVQSWFRRRQRLRQMEADEAAKNCEDHPDEVQRLVEENIDKEDFQRLSPVKMDALRRKRAEERIRRFVRDWKARRDGQTQASSEEQLGRRSSYQGWTIAYNFVRTPTLAQEIGPPKQCEVGDLIMAVGVEELQLPRDVVIGYVHQVVTRHWLEDLDDLDLVSSRHWQAWGVPLALAEKVHERVQYGVSEAFKKAYTWASAFFNADPEDSPAAAAPSPTSDAPDPPGAPVDNAAARQRRSKHAEQRRRRSSAAFVQRVMAHPASSLPQALCEAAERDAAAPPTSAEADTQLLAPPRFRGAGTAAVAGTP